MMNLHSGHRVNSFDALMGLNFQSLQSIDNLANLMQTSASSAAGGIGSNRQVPETGLKNADFSSMLAAASVGSPPAQAGGGLSGASAARIAGTPDRHLHHHSSATGTQSSFSSQSLSSPATAEDLSLNLAAARRLASAGRMESLLTSLSSNNMRGVGGLDASGSNGNLAQFLQSLQQQQQQQRAGSGAVGQGGGPSTGGGMGSVSAASLLGGGGPSGMSLADLLRQESSTGLSALRVQDGLNQRNSSSVDDFLSLMVAGDIPHQDPSLLNVPLLHQEGAAGGGGGGNGTAAASSSSSVGGADRHDAAKILAQSQVLQQLQEALASDRSFSNLAGLVAGGGHAPGGGGGGGGGSGSGGSSASAAAISAAQSQLNMLAATTLQQKRKLEELEAALAAQQQLQQQNQQQAQAVSSAAFASSSAKVPSDKLAPSPSSPSAPRDKVAKEVSEGGSRHYEEAREDEGGEEDESSRRQAGKRARTVE